jgi:thioredoxin 1
MSNANPPALIVRTGGLEAKWPSISATSTEKNKMSRTHEFTDLNFQSEVLDSEQPVLVDFWAAWCGPCRFVGPSIEELSAQFEGRVKVGKLDVDANQQAPARFGIHSIPAVLLFKDGEVVDTLIGVQPKQRYEDVLRKVAA